MKKEIKKRDDDVQVLRRGPKKGRSLGEQGNWMHIRSLAHNNELDFLRDHKFKEAKFVFLF